MVDGVVYTTAGSRRAVVAIDAASGELLWMHRENEGERGDVAPRQQSGRGLAYWSDGDVARIHLRHQGLSHVVAGRGYGSSGAGIRRERRRGPQA